MLAADPIENGRPEPPVALEPVRRRSGGHFHALHVTERVNAFADRAAASFGGPLQDPPREFGVPLFVPRDPALRCARFAVRGALGRARGLPGGDPFRDAAVEPAFRGEANEPVRPVQRGTRGLVW